jgi:hypothetical protein
LCATFQDLSYVPGFYPRSDTYYEPTKFIIDMCRLDNLSKEEYEEYMKLFRFLNRNIDITMEILNGLSQILFSRTHIV